MKLDHLKKIYYCRNENSESLSVQQRSPKLIKMSKYPYLIKRVTLQPYSCKTDKM